MLCTTALDGQCHQENMTPWCHYQIKEKLLHYSETSL